MNTTFKAKVLQHLNSKKQGSGEQGFTLIELLVVIIIIGILAAIALPSFLNQANKGKQAEGKQYTSSVNKAQQAWYTENNSFVSGAAEAAFTSLGVGIKTQTANYVYSISGNTTDLISVLATATSPALKGYAGTVGLVGAQGADRTSQSVVCESITAGTTAPAAGTTNASAVNCGSNMTAIK